MLSDLVLIAQHLSWASWISVNGRNQWRVTCTEAPSIIAVSDG